METIQALTAFDSGNPLIEAAYRAQYANHEEEGIGTWDWPILPDTPQHHWNMEQEWIGV